LQHYDTDVTYFRNGMTDHFEVYDAIEKNVGIQVYLSDDPGFAGVVKARYSDFIVHEGKTNHPIFLQEFGNS
jgi:diphthamide synthase subunit DPH2